MNPAEPFGWYVRKHSGEGAFTFVRPAESPGTQTVTPLVAAPPEGAPSYAELVDVLRRFEDDFSRRIESWGLNPRQRELHDDARALLSRIPKEEGAAE